MKMPEEIVLRVQPEIDLSAFTEETLDRLADLLAERIRVRMLRRAMVSARDKTRTGLT